nr:stalk domain-containing protein [Paenibacillus nasutitermitis]
MFVDSCADYFKSGEKMMSDAPLVLRNNSTFVPVRFVSEQLNTSVEYLGSKKWSSSSRIRRHKRIQFLGRIQGTWVASFLNSLPFQDSSFFLSTGNSARFHQ